MAWRQQRDVSLSSALRLAACFVLLFGFAFFGSCCLCVCLCVCMCCWLELELYTYVIAVVVSWLWLLLPTLLCSARHLPPLGEVELFVCVCVLLGWFVRWLHNVLQHRTKMNNSNNNERKKKPKLMTTHAKSEFEWAERARRE